MTDYLSEFDPGYTWPNPSFPFRVFLTSSNLRIFIIENISHNYHWLKKYAGGIRSTDYFFVIVGCHYHEWLAKKARESILSAGLEIDNFIILVNDLREEQLFSTQGFSTCFSNQNAWLDETLIPVASNADKEFDAIYVGRLIRIKRHYLASMVQRLALISGDLHSAKMIDNIPDHIFRNKARLSPSEVFALIAKSHCGLILSEKEGACFASSEYLLAGIPVVSTKSEGGRDAWYNEYNSIVCEPEPRHIAKAVDYFKSNPRDPWVIRNDHIKQARLHRLRFTSKLDELLHQHNLSRIDAQEYFEKNFFHKMRKSVSPDLDAIFTLPS